ncbi:MAG: RNA 2',3'-cyclic phosphodiesterase [Candidatus Woesearchaeota archaeon]
MRCFVAVNLPNDIREQLGDMVKGLREEKGKINWVQPQNMHITLKFLGDLDDAKIELVKEKLESVRFNKFSLTLDRLGTFPSENFISVLWIGVKEKDDLFDLHKMVDISLSKMFSLERNFLGHITLGRVKFLDDKKGFIEKLKKIKIDGKSFPVENFALMKSELTSNGPIYEKVNEFKLET